MRYLLTQDGITVVIDSRPYSISSHNNGFAEVRDAVLEKKDPVMVLGLIQAKGRFVEATVRRALQHQKLSGKLEYQEGILLYDGKPLYNYASETLVKFLELGHDVNALAAFIDKQQQNPDKTVHDELYKFLEYGKIPLTEDGDFLVYKAIRADYKDIHSGTFSNKVGDRPRLSGGRQAVDPDRHNTCSYGLHVCSFGYLPHFAHAEGHVMICKVDPRDVVAIPADYNNTKMRVIGYHVVGEVTSYYQRGENVLSDTLKNEQVASQRYEVWYEEIDVLKQLHDEFFTLDEAKEEADEICDDVHDGAVRAAWVVDKRTGKTVYGPV